MLLLCNGKFVYNVLLVPNGLVIRNNGYDNRQRCAIEGSSSLKKFPNSVRVYQQERTHDSAYSYKKKR